MDYQYIQVTKPRAHIGVITLHRPEAANALHTPLANELAQALRNVDESWRVLVISGAGERAFCAGADLKERAGMDKKAWEKQHHAFESAFDALAELEIPVIAAVNGAAVAGGLELALACDLIVACKNATFAFKEATLGIMPGLGGTVRLPRAMGERTAMYMLLTSETVNAKTAEEMGLINRVCDHLMRDALDLAETIAAAAPLSTRAIKKSVREGMRLSLEDALELELKLYGTLIETEDRKEGNQAFLEKRKPRFQGQ